MTTSTIKRVLLVVLGVAAVGGIFHQDIIGRVSYAVEKGRLEAGHEELARVEGISEVFRLVARQVKPAVVQIRTTAEVSGGSRGSRQPSLRREDIPEPFREFFEQFGDGVQAPRNPVREGSGSGVIIDASKGLILTNNHVVGDGDKDDTRMDVYLDDGRHFKAELVGRDPKTDLALVSIEADRLHELPLGDSDAAEVGDWVLAIGAPFGLSQTVTQGIISAKGRSHVGIVGIEDFIQTDAAINPGNSGGPLVNMRGELIGINTAIATSGLTAGYMGVGFAIPTKMIKQILPALKEGREIVRGYLGVRISSLQDEPGLAKTFGLDADRGVLIEEVQPRTPAAKAGLHDEDIVLGFNDKEVDSANELSEMVASTLPDTEVNLKVWRDGKEITIPVVIEKQPQDFYSQARLRGPGRGGPAEEENPSLTLDALGMTVEPLTAESAKRYGWEGADGKEQRLVVTEVEPLGEARALGIQAGDKILSVQGEEIKTVQELRSALSKDALTGGVRLRIETRSGPRTIFLQIGS